MIQRMLGLFFTQIRASERLSANHLLPPWRVQMYRSRINQQDTAERPEQLNAEHTAVSVAVAACWWLEYANSMNPMEKHATEMARNNT